MGLIVTSAEFIRLLFAGEYSKDGIWAWHIVREGYSSALLRILDPFASEWGVLAMLLVRIASSIGLISMYLLNFSSGLLVGMILVTSVVLAMRTKWGGEGGDQMTTIILICGFLADIYADDKVVTAYLAVFIGAQISLAYFASGAAKLFGPMWRQSVAFDEIMHNHSYGDRWLHSKIAEYPAVGKLICYGVIIFQVSFPLFFSLPYTIALIYPLIGFLFHASIAWFMRLNLFLFAFLGTYPCLLYSHQFVLNWVG